MFAKKRLFVPSAWKFVRANASRQTLKIKKWSSCSAKCICTPRSAELINLGQRSGCSTKQWQTFHWNVWTLSWRWYVPIRKLSLMPWVCQQVQSPLKKLGVMHMLSFSSRQISTREHGGAVHRAAAYLHLWNWRKLWNVRGAVSTPKSQRDYGRERYFRPSVSIHGRVRPGLVKAAQHHDFQGFEYGGRVPGFIGGIDWQMEERGFVAPRQVHC